MTFIERINKKRVLSFELTQKSQQTIYSNITVKCATAFNAYFSNSFKSYFKYRKNGSNPFYYR